MAAGVLVFSAVSAAGCSSKESEQVVIYSNADDEAVAAMKAALDSNGYEGQYIFQTAPERRHKIQIIYRQNHTD